MNKLVIISLSIFCLSCGPKKSLSLNSEYTGTQAKIEYIMIPSGAMVHSYHIIENNVKYTVGVVDDRIIYITTNDNRFSIFGLRINDLLPESFYNKERHYVPGWGYYIDLGSGWYVGFDHHSKPTEDTRIQWFFKYDFHNSQSSFLILRDKGRDSDIS